MMPQEKTKLMTEIKENSDLVEFVKSLTKEELARIKETREFDTIKPNTPTWRVALYNDSLRQQHRLITSTIQKRLWTIDDVQNKILRLEQQLLPGSKITEELKPGVTMTEDELRTLIQHSSWLQEGEVRAIPKSLADLRSIVAHKDVAKNTIISMPDYDAFVERIEKIVKQKGFDLFEGLPG
jgi:hypothetical protein